MARSWQQKRRDFLITELWVLSRVYYGRDVAKRRIQNDCSELTLDGLEGLCEVFYKVIADRKRNTLSHWYGTGGGWWIESKDQIRIKIPSPRYSYLPNISQDVSDIIVEDIS
jgi:hypothetical protein